MDRSLLSLDVPALAARIPAALTTKFAREDAKKCVCCCGTAFVERRN